MKTVGIVGGLGPESTVDYYQSIIAKFQERTGSKEILPELFIYSVNMYKVFEFISNQQLDQLAQYLIDAVQKLERAGVDFVAISANTPHIVFDQVKQKVEVPMISIVEETFVQAQKMGLQNIGLIGTRFTMENVFFKTPFLAHNMKITVPSISEQEYIHRKIVEELENGIVRQKTKLKFLEIIDRMSEQEQLEGIILGCTEFPMIIKQEDATLPQLNTTEIHVHKIVETMLSAQ